MIINVTRFFCGWFICLILLPAAIYGADLAQQREAFLQAEQLIAKGRYNAYKAKLAELEEYPLYAYLEYQWLKKNLHSDRAIKNFLQNHDNTRYSSVLRDLWLLDLGKRGLWKTLANHYQNSKNSAVQCQYQWAKYNTGHKRDAMMAAKKLWEVGYSQPKECDALLSALLKSKYFSNEMAWRRFELALRNAKTGLAKYIIRLLKKSDQNAADFWLHVHDNPNLIQTLNRSQRNYKQIGLIVAYGVERLASRDYLTAIAYWDQNKNKFTITNDRRQRIEKLLALKLALRKNDQAYSRLNQLQDGDETVREWQVRAALLQQNWQHVDHSLSRLHEDEKQTPKWQYWQARSFMQTGKQSKARQIFKKLAKDRSYYGFLAADFINQDYHFTDEPIQIEREQLAEFAQQADFRAVSELRFFNRDAEARRQWWYAVNKLDKEQLVIAAKLAQQWQWNMIAIFTTARAKHWDDLNLRFPIAYAGQIRKNAARRDLDPSIVFGLIRRESVFEKNARSPVGARGLMQIMPRTGKQIAKDLKEQWHSSNRLMDPVINLKYGTFYYKQLLDQFNGHFALAAAAYNAGPHRVKRWLPEKKAVPADIWIETIPFKETRNYVAAVLAYALIYQERTRRNTLRMTDFMLDVLPG